jgi:hypothetical protein
VPRKDSRDGEVIFCLPRSAAEGFPESVPGGVASPGEGGVVSKGQDVEQRSCIGGVHSVGRQLPGLAVSRAGPAARGLTVSLRLQWPHCSAS